LPKLRVLLDFLGDWFKFNIDEPVGQEVVDANHAVARATPIFKGC
jgi:hypothetical protein